jgi:hypothetical protein
MKIFTGINRMDAQPLLEYFAPLYSWLKEHNKNDFIGLKSLDPMECPKMQSRNISSLNIQKNNIK